MTNKIQPLDKTVVAEFKVTVADIHMRSRKMQGSVSARVGRESSFMQADANITTTQGVTITGIKKVLIIEAWKPIFLSLKNETGSIENIPCSGLFIHYGSFDEVTIKAQSEGDPVRVTYLYA